MVLVTGAKDWAYPSVFQPLVRVLESSTPTRPRNFNSSSNEVVHFHALELERDCWPMESPQPPHNEPSDSANQVTEEIIKPWKRVDATGEGLVSPERVPRNLSAESRRERWLRWFILWLHYPIMCMFYTTLAARYCTLTGTYGPAPADQLNTLPLTPLLARYPCDGSPGGKALYALRRYPNVFWNLLHMLQPEVWLTWVVLLSCARFPTAALLPSRWRGPAMFLLDYSCRLGSFVGTLLNGPRMPPGPAAVWHFYIGSPIVEVIVYLGIEVGRLLPQRGFTKPLIEARRMPHAIVAPMPHKLTRQAKGGCCCAQMHVA